jgi:uncharacterized protein YfaS (alpha-2-macroglobulin family)
MTAAWSGKIGVMAAVAAAVGLYATAFSAEPGMGKLQGRLLVADTEEPLAGVDVVLRPKIPRDGADTYQAETQPDGTFEILRLPAGAYDLEPQTHVYKNKAQTVTIQEGQVASVEAKLKPNAPFLNLYIHRHAFLPKEDPRVNLHGFRQGESLKLRLYAVNDTGLLLDYGRRLRPLLSPVSRTGKPGTFNALRSHQIRIEKEWPYQVRKVDAEGVFEDFLRLGPLDPGIYLVEAQGAATSGLGWLMVTDLALVTKSAGGKLVAYTTDLATGEPVPDAKLTVFDGQGRVSRTATDSRGLATVTVGKTSGRAEAIAQRGGSLAFGQFYAGGNGSDERYRVFTYTDRPVYRPGHHVRFKGIVRVPDGPGYDVPDVRTAAIRVTDDQGTEMYRGAAEVSDRGSFAGEFDLPEEAHGGSYTLKATVNGEAHEEYFSVASYRKPEWKVDVSTPQPRYVKGDRVPVTVKAEYYYGAPVAGAKVHYYVFRSRYWSWNDDTSGEYGTDYEESGEYSDSSGEMIEEADLTTNADGTAHFDFDTHITDDADQAGDYQYNLSVEVTDLSDRAVTGEGKVRVIAGALTLRAEVSEGVVKPGDAVTVHARARTFDDRPAAGIPVTAAAVLSKWDGKKEVETPLSTQTLQTNEKGEVDLPLQVSQTGSIVVRLSARDARGNRVETSEYVWSTTAEGGDFETKYAELSVVPDKKQYRVGDIAEILVNTDRTGATALVAVEAEEILELKLVPLKAHSTVVRFPIRTGYEPNVFVSACFVHDRQFSSTQARLNVDAEAHRLKVTIRSDRPTYHPRDEATFTLHAEDARGRPARAELSFGLVDESVYAIEEDTPAALWEAFYPRRQNNVETSFSFPEVYLGDADKEGSSVLIRKEFPDTADWRPFVRTDAAGNATVRVRLPDSLTSWRATVLAHTPETAVGRGTANVLVQKELTLRLQAPRALTEGDRLTLSAVAHNYTPSPADVAVSLNAQGVTLQSPQQQTVHVNPGEAQKVTWEATAQSPGTATLTATAVAGPYSDGVQLSLPVKASAKEDVQYQTGAVTESTAVEQFTTEPEAVDGSLELRVAPSLAGTILGSLDYLAAYPYGCTEQTMSSFLPDVVVQRTLGSLGIRRASLEKELPKMVRNGLLRLYGYQHSEGGWGWWEYDESDPWMTAYVLFGLGLARETGFDVNKQIYENGLNAADELAGSSTLRLDDAAFLAYVLRRAGHDDQARSLLARLAKDPTKLQIRSQGYRALALLEGSAEEGQQAKGIVDYLWSIADQSGGLYHWSEKMAPGVSSFVHTPISNPESTAVVLKAALAASPQDPRLAGVVRWLMLQREGNRWVSTRDTAWILYTLADYLKATGELKPDYTLTVLLNGKEVHSEVITPADALREERVVHVPFKELARDNRLEVRKNGEGAAYYSLKVRQQIRASSFAPESAVRGLSIQREYFRLATRRDAFGRPVVAPEKRPVTELRVGDRIMVRLTIKSETPMRYLMIEDPIPAGCEVQERGSVPQDEWDQWFAHLDVRDDRVSVFVTDLARGTHTIEYYLRPEATGRPRALPAVLSDMYIPSTRAATADTALTIAR